MRIGGVLRSTGHEARRNARKHSGSSGCSRCSPAYYCDDYIYINKMTGPISVTGWRSRAVKDDYVKFTCSTKDIAGAVGAASKVVNAHTTVPILSNVLLTADDGGIKVRATDLEITLEQSVSAEVARVRQRDGTGEAVQRLSRQPAPRDARDERDGVARDGQVRTLELRFPCAAARRVSAAAVGAERSRRSLSTRSVSAMASVRRSSLRRAKRRAARS